MLDFGAWLMNFLMNEKIWSVTTPVVKNFLQRIGDKIYFGIFGQSFVQMDDDTHPHQDKSG